MKETNKQKAARLSEHIAQGYVATPYTEYAKNIWLFGIVFTITFVALLIF